MDAGQDGTAMRTRARRDHRARARWGQASSSVESRHLHVLRGLMRICGELREKGGGNALAT